MGQGAIDGYENSAFTVPANRTTTYTAIAYDLTDGVAASRTATVTMTPPLAGQAFPSGTVIAWANPTIPNGWVVCDGNNGTPDLTNRFILGAGNLYAPMDHNSLTHSHTVSLKMTGTTSFGGSHGHGQPTAWRTAVCTSPYSSNGSHKQWAFYCPSNFGWMGTLSDHQHTFDVPIASSTQTMTGVFCPAYFALFYIMKQ